ncbi:MAG TPA: amino acid adenylation domain-containing protein, partial [Pyrinomonadaceae bacterium]
MSKRHKDISSLTLEQRAILEARLKKKRENVSRVPTIPRRPDAALSVLSFAQQRLWFLDQLEPGNPFYNGAAAVRLNGPLNVEALRQSLNEIVRRHEILRTTFHAVDGQPFQVVNEWRPLGLPVSDLTVLAADAREDEVSRLAADEVRQPFNLAEGPLLRISLLRLAEDEHVLLLVMHHIIGDGWSAGIFIGELAKLYEAFSTGAQSLLADLPAQYADFAHWQREWLQGDVLQRQLDYWKRVLAGAPTVLDLQTDRPRPVAQSFRGAKQSFQISEAVSDELRELSKREGVTLYMTLLAAFQTLLHRYTSQQEILVGSPIAGRNLSETEGLIGFFANTLVMRADFSGDPSWRELLMRVRESALGAYAHQELPFERLVEELQPERDLSRSPLIQAMLVLQNTPMPALELSGITLSLVRIDNMAARFDLYLAIEDAEQLTGTLEYNTDLFDASTISRFISHFQQLLRNIPAETGERVSHLPFLSEAERGRLLFEWNDTFAEYPREESLHHLFEAQVEKTPDAIALTFESEQLTYRQLNNRANQLAHYLRRLGVGPEELVAISIERSIEMVVGLLAILKAGGAYVPLDPAYPQSRLAFMLADAGVHTLLTQQSLVEVLPPSEARLLCIDSEWDEIARESSVNPVGGALAANLAYVIYTSGSTGQPKGVQISHGAVVNFLTSMERRPGLIDSDVLLAVTTLSFDIAGLEIYLPLIVGARLVIVSREVVADGAWLLGELGESGATVMQATPATWRMLLTEGWEGDKHLKALCGGEALSPELAAQISERTASLWNMYGPTETTIWSMLQEIGANDDLIPIGRPISNTQVYLLDQHLRPVATGLRGDIYIGGEGLARGYLNQPGLTAEKFVPHPFSVEKGARLYRTGDVGRQRENGVIEYLGRTDHQVKLRGYRIELGEVEAALRMQEGVQEAVAIVRDGAEAGHKSLVAYVVKTGSGTTTTSSLREGLRARLPEYMIPSIIVELEQLPLTPNGKVDRARLPEPDRSRVELDAELVLPRTPAEEVIAGLWADVLRVDEVGIHDNFFQLGGHSLLATQLISRIRDAFHLELPLRHLFEAPTVAALSRTIDLRLADAHGLHVPPILPISRDQELPLSFAQQRLWFLDQFEPGNPFYNIAAALRLRGQLDTDALAQSLDEVAARHESLRTTFISRDGLPVQLIGAPSPFNLDIIDLTHISEQAREAEARRLAAAEAQRPFDLSAGPLLRVSLLRLAEEEHILLFTMHHIIGDGWSIGVLVKEVSALYASFSSGEPSPLPELPIQYADFAHWQREWLQGEVLASQLSYWREQLAGAPAMLELPTDRPRPAVQSYRGAHHSVRLDAALTDELKRISRQEGVTLFMLLLAAFQTLLSRYSGQEDIVVGSPIANRTRAEVEGLIGFFVNTLVLRTRLDGKPSFREVLGRVREAALGAYAHQDVPFEMLVEELEPERDMSRTPLFQVMFVLQNAPQEAVELSGVELNSMQVESGTAKFDMTLSLTEAGGHLQGGLEYRTDLFDAASISRLISHFEILLKSII